MINFLNNSSEKPLKILKEKYDEAISKGERMTEVLSISSYSIDKKEVNSRYVNLKIVDNSNFIFFTNYNSPKSKEFLSHNNIAAILFWPSINTQIRMKAKIKKTSAAFNKEYFKQRSKDKNALAISSYQSEDISSFEEVLRKFNKVKSQEDLTLCPEYWGGFSFQPYEFEFWVGQDFRLNKRDHYKMKQGIWKHRILQP